MPKGIGYGKKTMKARKGGRTVKVTVKKTKKKK